MFNKNRVKKLEDRLESFEKLFMGLSKEIKHMDIRGNNLITVLNEKIKRLENHTDNLIKNVNVKPEKSTVLKIKKKIKINEPVFEAIQWTGKNHNQVISFCGSKAMWHMHINHVSLLGGELNNMNIPYVNYVSVPVGNWIVKDEKGECYSCTSDFLESTYEEE